MGGFAFSKKEAYEEIKPLLERISNIENIFVLFDLNSLIEKIFNDLSSSGVIKEYKNEEQV